MNCRHCKTSLAIRFHKPRRTHRWELLTIWIHSFSEVWLLYSINSAAQAQSCSQSNCLVIPQVRKFLVSFCKHKSANFWGVPVRKFVMIDPQIAKPQISLVSSRQIENPQICMENSNLFQKPKVVFKFECEHFKLIFVWRKIMYFGGFAVLSSQKIIGSPNRKDLYCPHVANPQIATFAEGRKFAVFRFAELICRPPHLWLRPCSRYAAKM